MKLPQIVTSLLENDMYKYSMGQAIYHQFPGYMTTWAFKCRNKDVKFTPEMVEEIRDQVKAYCRLRYTEPELKFIGSIKWIKGNYVDFLRLWQPRYEDFDIGTDDPCGLSIITRGTWLNTSMYEIPTLYIVNEVYHRMAYDYDRLITNFGKKLDEKFHALKSGEYYVGSFSDFGLRRRLSGEAHEMAISTFAKLNDTLGCSSRFVGTSDVYLAWKYGLIPTGTQAHEWTMCVGQGNHKHDPAYSNWYAMKAWVKEYGILNGTALSDTLGTNLFLMDFQLTFATLFKGVRHDSGDPFAWGDKMVDHYGKLGIDPRDKMLLFSDSLNFQKADKIFRYFNGRTQTAFGIGTYLTNDTYLDIDGDVEPLNIVMKPILCNGRAVAKLSDTAGKGMCRDDEYVEHLQDCIRWRMKHEAKNA